MEARVPPGTEIPVVFGGGTSGLSGFLCGSRFGNGTCGRERESEICYEQARDSTIKL